MDSLLLKFEKFDFEGPLDMLLSLIAKNKLDIYDIPLLSIIEQYLEQIDTYKRQNMDISSEFLEMAARLIYMKTVSLLPKHEEIEQLKEQLQGELLEYKICREMAEKLSAMTSGFDCFVKKESEFEFDKTYELTHNSEVVFEAYNMAVGRGLRKMPPPVSAFTKIVAKKIYSVSSKIVSVLKRLKPKKPQKLKTLFEESKSRSEIVATFLAVLELCKSNRVLIKGDGSNADIILANPERSSNED